MVAFLRSVRLLALVTWMGGLIFFGAIAAPAIFSPQILSLTGGTRIPGLIVAACLSRLHIVGLVCGCLLILTAGLLARITGRNRVQNVIICLLTAVMIALTAFTAFHIMPLMEHDRQLVGGDFAIVPTTSPERADFDHLHILSTRLESFALFCALGIVLCLATEDLPSRQRA